MALQNDGEIKLSDIQEEFGGSHPSQLSEYYSVDTEVPTSGVIKFSDFYGASAATHQWTIGSIYSGNSYGFNDSDLDGNCEEVTPIGGLSPNVVSSPSGDLRIRSLTVNQFTAGSPAIGMEVDAFLDDGQQFKIDVEGESFIISVEADWCFYWGETTISTTLYDSIVAKEGQTIGVTITFL